MLDDLLRRACYDALAETGGGARVVRAAFRHDFEREDVVVRIEFSVGSTKSFRLLPNQFPRSFAAMHPVAVDRDVRARAERAWSLAFEDWQERQTIERYQRLMDEMLNAGIDPADSRVRRLRYERDQRIEHARRHHQAANIPPDVWGPPAHDAADAIGYGQTTNIHVRPSPTATEVQQRAAEALNRMMPVISAEMERRSQAMFEAVMLYGHAFIDPRSPLDGPDREASARAESLLKEHLSLDQLAQFKEHGWFEVVGSKTGKHYRIKRGRQQNVFELDRKGHEVCGWCFLPQGGLAEGDCMLAQKIALETDEKAALKIANRFGGREDTSHWDDLTRYVRSGRF